MRINKNPLAHNFPLASYPFAHNMRGMSAIRHIRREIFRATQAEFAALAGVTQATVSRWEAGGAPSLDEMQAIRKAAAARAIEWNDAWFFDVPVEDAAE